MGLSDRLDQYLASAEQFLADTARSLPSSTQVQDRATQLWHDITRYGPPSVSVPGLGTFNLDPPPPPPPPPPPEPVWTRTAVVASAGLGAAAVVAVGYGAYRLRKARQAAARARAAQIARGRREVVVVLGADSALGRTLVLDLESRGYIVIASVATPAAVDDLERRARGYVRVLVLDPNEPETVPNFIRSLQATLSIRFPTNTPGDPYLPPTAAHPYVHALVSLLALAQPATPTPLEALSVQKAYLPHLQAAHLTPLSVIQALLPLFRSNPPTGKKSVILCLPTTQAAAFNGAAAAVHNANASLAQTLRAELRPLGVRVVTVRTDLVSPATSLPLSASQSQALPLTPGQKQAYGGALETLAVPKPNATPAEVSNAIVTAISRGIPSAHSTRPTSTLALLHGVFSDRVLRGDTFTIGGIPLEFLPGFLRDALLALPSIFVGIRNAIIPLPPPPPAAPAARRPLPSPPTASAPPQNVQPPRMIEAPRPIMPIPTHAMLPDEEHDHDSETSSFSGTVSDADLDFESGEDGAASSGAWVSLRDRRATGATVTGP
ncbi:hypothetical protein AURDEDRAFT_114440 [Auricularia subglabra TFB-10046 SS5]|nr:hypothetical protein AURDEDRAFT_114440 [Auricularia subglabra TFB-10046 SS5]